MKPAERIAGKVLLNSTILLLKLFRSIGPGQVSSQREVEKIHNEYKTLLKNKSKTTESFVKARENFLMKENEKGEKIEKLFDVGNSDLEKTL